MDAHFERMPVRSSRWARAAPPARAVVASLAAQGAREIRFVNRTFERAQGTARAFGSPMTAVPWEQRDDALAGVALRAKATSLGMAGTPALEITAELRQALEATFQVAAALCA